MAKLQLTIDTESYSCDASVDGRPIANVDGVTVYNFGSADRPQYSFSVSTFEIREGVRVTSCVSAADVGRLADPGAEGLVGEIAAVAACLAGRRAK